MWKTIKNCVVETKNNTLTDLDDLSDDSGIDGTESSLSNYITHKTPLYANHYKGWLKFLTTLKKHNYSGLTKKIKDFIKQNNEFKVKNYVNWINCMDVVLCVDGEIYGSDKVSVYILKEFIPNNNKEHWNLYLGMLKELNIITHHNVGDFEIKMMEALNGEQYDDDVDIFGQVVRFIHEITGGYQEFVEYV